MKALLGYTPKQALACLAFAIAFWVFIVVFWPQPSQDEIRAHERLALTNENAAPK